MRILALSNLYPPHVIGGYELGCRDVVETLRKRGHEVHVLTSMYGIGHPESSDHVDRTLETRIGKRPPSNRLQGIGDTIKLESTNQRLFFAAVKKFKPDVVYGWNMDGISITLILFAQELGIPVSLFISDHWLIVWRQQSILNLWRLTTPDSELNLPRKLGRAALTMTGLMPYQLNLDLSHAQFCSDFLRNEITEDRDLVSNALIAHWNVDTTLFYPDYDRPSGKKAVYCGQLSPHKGVHIALEAYCKAVSRGGASDAELTIAGGALDESYLASLKEIPQKYGINSGVKFIGKVSREALAQIYREHDILLFPSIWDEPFSIALLEGMASGLAVVGTMTGGTPEILLDEVNALTYAKENVDECAAQIERLFDSQELRISLSNAALKAIQERFAFPRMVDLIEADLELAVSRTKR